MKKIYYFFMSLTILLACENRIKSNQEASSVPPKSKEDSKELNGTWELIERNDTLFNILNIYPSGSGGQPRLIINTKEQKIGGFTGCNAWGTTIYVSVNSFTLNDNIEANQQGCPGNWERDFLNDLRTNKSYAFIDGNLKLTSQNNQSMTFKKISEIN